MNQPLHNPFLSRSLVRLAFASFCLLLTGADGLASPAPGKDPLKRTISLSVVNQPMEVVLERLEKTADVQFAYSYEAIQADRKVSLTARNERLEKVLNELLTPLQISYTVSGERMIILKHQVTLPALPAAEPKAALPAGPVQTADRLITGLVTDAVNAPLPGVNVLLKGSSTGATTDGEGRYKITVPDQGAGSTLQFSSIGYEPQEVSIGNRSVINVTLEEANKTLNEVVVVGYGVQKKADLTGAVSTISGKDIARLPVASVDQALQGKAAGVRVTQSSGQPGEGVSVRIRGVGTINDNSPLFVIDGVPTKDPFTVLNPADVESMSVLKDASSAAIYGSRAANGVVVITTKRGKSGAPRISFNSYGGVQTHGRLIPMANTADYVRIFNESVVNDNVGVTNPILQRKPIPDALVPTLANTDWQRAIFQAAPIQNYQLSFSGGTDRSHYLLSGNYFNQQGIIINSGYTRYALRASIDTDIGGKVKVGTNLNLTFAQRTIVGSSGDGYGGNGGSIVRYALFHTPAVAVYDSTGNFIDLPSNPALLGDGYNPVGLARKQDNKQLQYRIFGDVFGEWQITPNLRFRTDGGLDLTITNAKRFNENWGTNNRINSPATLTNSISPVSSLNWNNTLNYTRTFGGQHTLTALVGTEAIQYDSRQVGGSDRNFIDQMSNLRYLGLGTDPTGRNSFESDQRWSLLSFFGRVNYAYKDKYLATVNVRRDGSSRFAPQNRWGTFFSGSVGWNIDREAFFQRFINTVSLLKVRASVGQLGNQDIGTYPYASLLGSGFNYPFGGTQQPGYAITSRGNSNVKWESSTQTDIGLDLGLWNNRIQFTADVFEKITSDMLIPVPVPRSGGSASVPYVNAGRVSNRGLELDLTYRDKKGDFSYDITANASFLRNRILSLSDGRPIPGGRIDNGVFATLTEPGYSIGSFYLLQQDGIFQNESDIFTSANQGNGIQPGDVRYKDINGDGVINEKDRSHVGSAIPTLLFGVTANLYWKGFDATIFVQGASGNQIYYQVATDIEGFYRAFNITERVVQDHWHGEGTSNTQPRVSWRGAANNKQPSTRFLENGAYTRLKNLQIGYTLPGTLTKRFGAPSVRVYVSGQNLLTFTKYPGLDPEQQSSDNVNNEQFRGDVAVGIDWGTYPSARTYTLGLNVNF